MRHPVRLTMLALFALAAQAAQAVPVTWNIGGTLTNVRTLGNFGSPDVGSPFSVQAVVESDTPDASAPIADGYYGLFSSFALSIGDAVLTLDPLTSITDPSQSNSFTVLRTNSFEQLQFAAALTDGVNEFATEFILNFSDPDAYPLHDLTASLPALDTRFDRFPGRDEFQLYSPAAGGGEIFLAGGKVTSLSSSVAAVSAPEPATVVLFAMGLGVLGVCWRRRGHVQSGSTRPAQLISSANPARDTPEYGR